MLSTQQQVALLQTAAEPQHATCLRLPNLFVVGAAKSGTTALYHYFKRHPEVFVPPVKEVNYMAFFDGLPSLCGPGDQFTGVDSVTDFASYVKLYSPRTTEVVAADVSPAYLMCPEAAAKIAELCPQGKIVIVLRNPVECAFSMYSMLRRDRRETCRSFREAFFKSEQRIAAGWEAAWDYYRVYLYSRQVQRYLELFPESQLFIRRYEELKQSPVQFYRELCKFLNIGEIDVTKANQRFNIGCTRRDLIRTRKLGRWALRTARVAGFFCPSSIKAPLRDYLSQPAFELCREDRQMLVDHFAPDILRLGEMLSWDLGSWLQV